MTPILAMWHNAEMEREFVRWLCGRLPGHERLVVGAGDDAAVLRLTPGMELVATTDMLMDGVDFELALHEAAQIGRKALAVNLSDLAAMAARPVGALVSVALPRDGGERLGKQLLEGMLPLANEFNCPLIGGDTNSWDSQLVISVTALGEALPGRTWVRSGAKAGDLLLVTGRFGGSILGRQFTFEPRVAEALWLSEHAEMHAAIDVSDGLSLDLARLCEASGCGADLDLPRVPVSSDAERLAATSGKPAIDHALGDGEDFELILAVPPDEMARLAECWPFEVGLTQIGRFCVEPGLFAINPAGQRQALKPKGYEHRLTQ
jgi:thiamine-monophosphate kinase